MLLRVPDAITQQAERKLVEDVVIKVATKAMATIISVKQQVANAIIMPGFVLLSDIIVFPSFVIRRCEFCRPPIANVGKIPGGH